MYRGFPSSVSTGPGGNPAPHRHTIHRLVTRRASLAVAAAVGVIALSWIVERGFATVNPLAAGHIALLAGPERLAVILLGVALAIMVARRDSVLTTSRGPQVG